MAKYPYFRKTIFVVPNKDGSDRAVEIPYFHRPPVQFFYENLNYEERYDEFRCIRELLELDTVGPVKFPYNGRMSD